MRYLPELDVFLGDDENYYVKNEFDPENPIFINVTGDVWSANYKGEAYSINWSEINLDENVIQEFKYLAKEKLKKNALKYMVNFKHTLIKVSEVTSNTWTSFSDLSMEDFLKIWEHLIPHYRSYFREWYIYFAENNILGADIRMAREIETWKARKEHLHLKDVLYWDKEKGSLTRQEERILRNILRDYKDKNPKDLGIHVFAWAMLETVKRSSQVLHIKADGLKCIGDNNKEYFLEMTPVKYQTGDDVSWWKISSELAELIQHYSEISEIKSLQNKYDKLIVWESSSLKERGVVSSATMGSALKNYIKSKKIISPRTGGILHIKPLRLRHTGATRLAANGIARDVIQEILEHDSRESAQAYIDAIGSDLLPKLEQSDRNMGSFFKQLENAYFKGNVVQKSEKPPIVVPEYDSNPLIVGSCAKNTVKDGACGRHPFLSCYNGCGNFLAWRETDHYKSLNYIDKEIERWESFLSEGDNHSVLNEYKKVRESIVEVINLIEKDKE